MARSLPPLTWFRAFEAAARHLSFTAAAEELGMTQSAISQQVKSLEQRLRVPLFVRQARGLSLTDHGRRLLPEVGAPLEALAAATARFDAGPSADLLTVATSVSVAQWVIAPNLPDFTAQHPEVRARFLSAIWPDDFHSAQADVEIRFGSEKQVGRDAEPLLPNRLVALKSPELAGALDELPLIEAVGTSTGWRGWCEAFGGDLQPTLYADTYGMALQLAAHGNGVALVSELLAQHALRARLVVPAHPGSVASKEGYFLSVRADHAAALRFRDWLLALLAR
ncbi:LysR family transcriptional regulator [Marinovum sp.]|uniref:LysR family transcriptional regulator n=1 Tax=Marinovum sp. TaxID=2024839 RepID=UPI003A92938F